MDKSNKLLEMSVFVAVVDCNSFVAAADKLKMSKQAVSRNISNLEERLQVRLLQRTTRTMALTYEGQTFYLHAKSIMSAISEAESIVNLDNANPAGMLRINVPMSFGILYLAPLWQKFINKYPKIELDISLSDRVVNLLDEGYDLAVRIGQLENSTLIARKLTSSRIIAAASPDYLLQHGTPQHPDELQNHKIITYSYWVGKNQWSFWKDKRLYPVQVNGMVHSNNGDTCRMLMLHGGGISLQPEFMISDDLKNGHLIEVLPDYQLNDVNIYVVYPSRKLLPLRTRCLIDFLIEQLSGYVW